MNFAYPLTGSVYNTLFVFCVTFATLTGTASAANWIPVQGEIRLADGTPVCAMALANGQYVFSCGGDGSFRLAVPLDDNGQITLFAFADGFAPFSITAHLSNLTSRVQLDRARPDSPTIDVGLSCSQQDSGWVRMAGQVTSGQGSLLCSMVLANGQHTFSCDGSLGLYDVTVPVDAQGNITLFAFADGFQPFRNTFSGASCGSDPRALVERLVGTWDFKHQIISVWVDRYALLGPAVESPEGSGKYFLLGEDVWGIP